MTTQTPDAVRDALERRKAINTVLGRLLAPLVPDVVERIRIGNEACTAILAALDSRAGDAGEGWKLVPVEPTPEMLSRGDGVTDFILPDGTHDNSKNARMSELRIAWQAMIEVAPAPAVDAVEKLTLNPTPLEKMADDMTGGDPVNDMAIRLMRAWAKADPRSGVAQYPASYVANFACIAADVVASAVDAVPAGEDIDDWLRGDWYERWQDATETADEELMATLESLRGRVEQTIRAALSHGEGRRHP